jgi:serine/threonine-protein kinase
MMAAARSPIRIVGRYAIYNEIAAGGMATIHLGRLLGPVGFARTVAVKRLHPQYAKDPEFVSMFLDEARVAARVQHPNVVATIDVVATEGELFLIMDYVRGESLSKMLRILKRDNQRMPPRIATAIMCGFLHGLHAAHEAKNERGEPLGLVHRDVSPQNVLVGADGIARVLDFGIAKAAGRIQVTKDGQIKGKLAYMPPEQLAGRELTRAVDVYASAVVMWETLTTERLFKGESDGATLAKILRDNVPSPSSVHRDLAPFDAPLLRALARDPGKRHATAKALAIELERCMGIGSPTEVGEWVDALVGPVLNAREEQIAEIESSSATLRLPDFPDSSDSDKRPLPSTRTILAALSAHGTGTNGDTKLTPRLVIPSSSASAVGPDEQTATSKSRMSWLTSSRVALPVDRKLPLALAVAGALGLIVIVAVLISANQSRGNAENTEKEPVAASASAGVSAALPAPPLSSTADSPPQSVAEQPTATESASSDPPPRPTALAPQRPAAPKPTAQVAPSTTAPRKNNCDPPYTLDAQGRHKYKRECM